MISNVLVWPVASGKSLKANGVMTIAEAFKVKFMLMENKTDQSLFVTFQSEKYTDKKTGEEKYSSLIQCLDKAVQAEMNGMVIAAYQAKLSGDTQAPSPEPENQVVKAKVASAPVRKNTPPF